MSRANRSRALLLSRRDLLRAGGVGALAMAVPGTAAARGDVDRDPRGQAAAPGDSPYLGAIVSRVRPSERNVANYVWLIRCVGDPVFCAPNIGSGGHLGAQYTPLFIGAANNHPAMPTFRAPDELQPAV